MKKILLVLTAMLIILGTRVYAEEAPKEAAPEEQATEMQQESEMPSEEAYVFPVMNPEATLFVGYRFVNLNGSASAGEFEFLHNSPTFGGELRLFSFPHRFHLDLDWTNRKDYFGDLSYAYKDLVLFRGINRTLFHNLENITLIDLDPATTPSTVPPGQAVAVRDADEEFGLRVGITSAFLRFKAPDFPFHIYLDGTLIKKDGIQQQRFLQGSGSFNNIVRVSEKREIDWETTNITVGANSHLGPIEADFSHGEKRLEVGENSALFHSFDPTTARPAGGIFAHNAVPELKSSTNTLKLHTSYTGSLVASATLSTVNKENRNSGADADYLFGAGDVTWVPMPRLAFFFKYRYRESDVDNPDFVTVRDFATGALTTISDIRPSISSVTNTFSVASRYKIASGITARAEYAYDSTNRSHTDTSNRTESRWFVSDETRKNTATLSADVRLRRNMVLNLKYTHRDINSPELNIDPDRADEGKVSLTWIPIPQISALLSLWTAREKRDRAMFVHDEPDPPAPAPPIPPEIINSLGERRVSKDRLLGSVTFLPLKNLSLTTSYFYYRHKIKEDLSFHDTAGGHHFDQGVPNTATSYTYAADISYAPHENISLTSGVSHTLSKGSFAISDPNLRIPAFAFSGFEVDSIASFSEMKIRENLYYVSGEYQFRGGFTAGVHYKYSSFKDLLGNPYDDVDSGRAQIILLTLSKKW